MKAIDHLMFSLINVIGFFFRVYAHIPRSTQPLNRKGWATSAIFSWNLSVLNNIGVILTCI